NRPRGDADGSGNRPPAKLFLSIGVSISANLRVSRDDPAAVSSRPPGAAAVDGGMRYEPGLFAGDGPNPHRWTLHHDWMGNLGIQSHSRRRRANGATHRH